MGSPSQKELLLSGTPRIPNHQVAIGWQTEFRMFLWKGWTSQRRPMEFQTMEPCSPSKKNPHSDWGEMDEQNQKNITDLQVPNKQQNHVSSFLPGFQLPSPKTKHIRFTTGNEHPENIIPSVHQWNRHSDKRAPHARELHPRPTSTDCPLSPQGQWRLCGSHPPSLLAHFAHHLPSLQAWN